MCATRCSRGTLFYNASGLQTSMVRVGEVSGMGALAAGSVGGLEITNFTAPVAAIAPRTAPKINPMTIGMTGLAHFICASA
jgi:hypothetical protein